MESACALEGVRVAHAGRTVLDIDRFELASGRTTVLTGANGAGKTTLLDAIGLVRPPQTGTLRLAGGPPLGPADYHSPAASVCRMAIGYLMQEPYLFRTSVLENIRMPLRWHGLDPARAGSWAERLDLGRLADSPARALSTGEKRRLALARVLAYEPRLLLLDEPFAGVDADSERLLSREIVGFLEGRPERAVLLTTHARETARLLGQEIVRLENGRIVPWGGSSLLRGLYLAGVDGHRFRCRSGLTLVCDPMPEGTALAALDAADVIVARGPVESSVRNVLEVDVVSVAAVGEGIELALTAADGTLLHARITRSALGELHLLPGDRVSALFKASAVRPVG